MTLSNLPHNPISTLTSFYIACSFIYNNNYYFDMIDYIQWNPSIAATLEGLFVHTLFIWDLGFEFET